MSCLLDLISTGNNFRASNSADADRSSQDIDADSETGIFSIPVIIAFKNDVARMAPIALLPLRGVPLSFMIIVLIEFLIQSTFMDGIRYHCR